MIIHLNVLGLVLQELPLLASFGLYPKMGQGQYDDDPGESRTTGLQFANYLVLVSVQCVIK